MRRLEWNILHNMEILKRIMENILIKHAHHFQLDQKDIIIYWIILFKKETTIDCYIREY